MTERRDVWSVQELPDEALTTLLRTVANEIDRRAKLKRFAAQDHNGAVAPARAGRHPRVNEGDF